MITRRQLISGTAATASYMAISRLCGASESSGWSGPLDAVAVSRGWHVGIAADTTSLLTPEFAQVVCRNFDLITSSEMKWNRVHPEPGTFDFGEADRGVEFGLKNGLRVHGHNLCWNSPEAYPPWFSTVLNRSNAEHYLTTHIATVAGHYKHHIDSWDVVNEPIASWSTRSDFLYPGIWIDLLGPRYIDIAFHAAANADPHALRVLNIYDVEQNSPRSAQARQATLALLERLMTQHVPVQAIGIESHLDVTQALGGTAFASFLQNVHSFGLEIMITELDVKETRSRGVSIDWDREVADYYAAYLDLTLPFVSARRVIFWSLTDRWSRQRRIQGLFESDFLPRMSFEAARSSLAKNCF